MKLPQIYALLSSKSAVGISLRSYWFGIGSYLIGFFYGYTNNFHISIYAELGFLSVQDAIIIFLVMNYSRKWTLENLIYIAISIIFVVGSLFGVIPRLLFQFLLSSTLFTSSVSKIMQIVSLYQLKAQGDVSIVTWGLATYGCAVRVFTVLVEVGDLQILLNYCIAVILNATVVALCLYYGTGTIKQH